MLGAMAVVLVSWVDSVKIATLVGEISTSSVDRALAQSLDSASAPVIRAAARPATDRKPTDRPLSSNSALPSGIVNGPDVCSVCHGQNQEKGVSCSIIKL